MALIFRFFFQVSLALLIFVPLVSCSQKAATSKTVEYKVSGTITQTHAYCGGARPPKELMDNLTKPSPFPGKKVYIRSGTENSLDKPVIRELIADTGGRFSLLLPSGTYCIIQEEQVKTLDTDFFRKKLTSYHKLDEACLKQWWSKCLMTFEVGATDKTDLNINFHFPCFTNGVPCVTYTGPLPQ
jgi:hypothetical protein